MIADDTPDSAGDPATPGSADSPTSAEAAVERAREIVCSLCGAPAQTGALLFLHERPRRGDRVVLNIRLCEACGDRMEKHLKRAIPKRLMDIRTVPPQPVP